MTDLRTAAQQALEALAVATNCLDGYYIPRGKTTLPEIEDAITALRAALAEPVQQGCDHCNSPLYAAVKCRVCGRVTEPVQEPRGAAMNRDEIERMAREAGLFVPQAGIPENGALTRFADLVAAAEREACATFLERVVDLSHLNKHRVWQKYTAELLLGCAAAIRTRSNP